MTDYGIRGEQPEGKQGLGVHYWSGVLIAALLTMALWFLPTREGISWHRPPWLEILTYLACFASWHWAFVVLGLIVGGCMSAAYVW